MKDQFASQKANPYFLNKTEKREGNKEIGDKQNLHRVFSDAWILHVYVDLSCFCPLLGTNQA